MSELQAGNPRVYVQSYMTGADNDKRGTTINADIGKYSDGAETGLLANINVSSWQAGIGLEFESPEALTAWCMEVLKLTIKATAESDRIISERAEAKRAEEAATV